MRVILFSSLICIIFCWKNKSAHQRSAMANKTIHKMKEQFKNDLMKKPSSKPKDYWSSEEYSEYGNEDPSFNDETYSYKDDSPSDDPLWNEDPLWTEDDDPLWNDDPLWDDDDDVSGGQETDRGQCGPGARRGRLQTLTLRYDDPVQRDAIHISCGDGGCIGQVLFSSCHTRGLFKP